MTREIKPCPFCGGEAVVDGTTWRASDGEEVCWISCRSCNGSSPADTPAEAIAAWNRRAETAAMPSDWNAAIRAAAEACRTVGSPVGAGDGCGTFIPGTSAQAERAILALLRPEDAPTDPVRGEPVTLTYTNWRGETAERTIIPRRVWWGSTEWHPEPQWLLTAIDVEKQAERDFALRDFGRPTTVAEAARGLTIARLQRAHVDRQDEWCPDQKPDLSFRGNELGGECGEAQNVIKKLERERHGWRGSRDTVEHLGEELADVIHCAILCAITAGIDLEPAVMAKFDSTSEKNGLSTFLRALAGEGKP